MCYLLYSIEAGSLKTFKTLSYLRHLIHLLSKHSDLKNMDTEFFERKKYLKETMINMNTNCESLFSLTPFSGELMYKSINIFNDCRMVSVDNWPPSPSPPPDSSNSGVFSSNSMISSALASLPLKAATCIALYRNPTCRSGDVSLTCFVYIDVQVITRIILTMI